MTIKITPRQAAVWRYLADCALREGRSPSMREIGAELSIRSTNGVSCHLRALIRKGYIEMVPGRPRSIRLRIWPPAEVDDYGEGSHLRRMDDMIRASAEERVCEWCARRALPFGTSPRCRTHANM